MKRFEYQLPNSPVGWITVTEFPYIRSSIQDPEKVLSTGRAMVFRDQVRAQRLPDAQGIEHIECLQHAGIVIRLAIFLNIILPGSVAPDIDPE
jgi:hypothetical protein